MKCELCNRPASNVYNVLGEIDPVADKSGQLWAAYEKVLGPHPRCNDHKMSLRENVLGPTVQRWNPGQELIELQAEMRTELANTGAIK